MVYLRMQEPVIVTTTSILAVNGNAQASEGNARMPLKILKFNKK